jgi:ABC-type amino acid transport substrate-binding protein
MYQYSIMKKILMICAVLIGFAFTASAQDNQKAEFKFIEEKHDFGKIPQGTPVTTVFEFTNIGQEPLILTTVQPTCGCTIADFTKTPVKSGDKGKITITYNAAYAAPFSKTIVVKSNAKTPEKYLVIVGEVVAKQATASSK